MSARKASCSRVVLVALLALSPAAVGAAQATAALALGADVDACVPVDPARFRHLLAVELVDANALEVSSSRLRLRCVDAHVELQLTDALTRKSLIRRIDLARVEPSARDRLAALSAAELVHASWLEVVLFEREQVEPVGPPPSPGQIAKLQALTEARASRPARLQLGLAVETLVFTSPMQLVPGVMLRLTLPLTAALALRVGMQAGYTRLAGALPGARPARTTKLTATLASLQLALLYAHRAGGLELVVGPGARAGVASLTADQPDDATLRAEPFFAPWAGPLLAAGAAYTLSSRLRLTLALELGYVALRPRALAPDGTVVSQLGGLWTSASAGLDWSPIN